jgi:beta-galactosidase
MKMQTVSLIAAVSIVASLSAADAPRPGAKNHGEAYLFSYFSDKGHGGRRGEAAGMRLAYSYDGLKWTALNGETPFMMPKVGRAKLMRDPSICRGPDGTFHLVWTTGWGERVIGHSSSKDLVEWTGQQEIPVMAHEPTARNCWAPEVTYNPDDGLFYVYWATTIPGRHSGDGRNERGASNHRIYLTTTKDWKSFSPTRLWFNPEFSAIDAALLRTDGLAGAPRRWLMAVKNENGNAKNIRLVWTNCLSEPWAGKEILPPVTGNWVEGPSILKVGGDVFIYFDCYTKHRYGAVKSTDGGRSWNDVSNAVSFPKGIRHGTAFAVPLEMVRALVSRFGGNGK